jgi:putative aldouronate transport system substrate-binding protein
MKFKRVLCAIIILTMFFTLFTACAGNSKTTDNTKTTDSTDSTATQTGTQTEEKEPPMIVTASINSDGSKYYTLMADPSRDKYIKKIEELANIKLDITVREHSKEQELVNLIFASGEIPDIFGYRDISCDPIVLKALENEIFMNMKPYINVENTPNLITSVPEKAWELADIFNDESIYYVPVYINTPSNAGFYIRQDLLEKYDMEDPVTLDDFTNVMRVFKKNGVKYPLTARQSIANLEPFFGAFGVLIHVYIMTDEGKIEPAAIQPGMKEALAYIRGLYAEGLLDPEFLTNSLDPFTNKIMNGDVGIFRHGASNYTMWQEGIVKNVPEAKLKMILGPVGSDGKSAIGNATSCVDAKTYVNSNVKDPARIARYFDWMCTDEAAEFFSYGIEGDTYTKTNGKINFTYPTTADGEDELIARTYNLWRVRDRFDNPLLAPFIPYAEYIQDYRNKVAKTVNVIHQVALLGSDLKIYQTSPELKCGYSNDSLFQEIAIKIIFGKAEVDEFDNWLNGWRKRGGDKVLEQLEEKRAAGEYVIY